MLVLSMHPHFEKRVTVRYYDYQEVYESDKKKQNTKSPSWDRAILGLTSCTNFLRQPGLMELALLAGIDPTSEGLARARELGIPVSHHGIEAILGTGFDSDRL